MKKFCLFLGILAFFANFAFAGQFLKVGDKAPDFSLVDDSGTKVRLSEFIGIKNVVLIFYAEHS